MRLVSRMSCPFSSMTRRRPDGGVGAEQTEIRDGGPAVAEQEEDGGDGEEEVGRHAETVDGGDGGTEISEGDGEEGERGGAEMIGEVEDVDGPKDEERAGEKRAGDDADGREGLGGVEDDVEPGEAEAEQGAREEAKRGCAFP